MVRKRGASNTRKAKVPEKAHLGFGQQLTEGRENKGKLRPSHVRTQEVKDLTIPQGSQTGSDHTKLWILER